MLFESQISFFLFVSDKCYYWILKWIQIKEIDKLVYLIRG